MAQGDQRAADSVSEQTGKKVFDYAADQLKVLLASDTFAACADFTDVTQFTEVTGTGYTAGGENTTGTWTRSANSDISELQAGDVSWAQDAGGPTDIRVAVLYSSAVGADDVITVVDVTTDAGVTPVSLQAGALNVNFSNSVTMRVQRQ